MHTPLVLSYDAPAEPRVPLGRQIWAVVDAIIVFVVTIIIGLAVVLGCLFNLNDGRSEAKVPMTIVVLLGALLLATKRAKATYENSMMKARLKISRARTAGSKHG